MRTSLIASDAQNATAKRMRETQEELHAPGLEYRRAIQQQEAQNMTSYLLALVHNRLPFMLH
jgi:hypothetical protein